MEKMPPPHGCFSILCFQKIEDIVKKFILLETMARYKESKYKWINNMPLDFIGVASS